MADTLAESAAEIIGDTLVDVKSMTLIANPADTLSVRNDHALGDTQSDLKAEALVDTLADTFNRGQIRYTWRHTCQCADQTTVKRDDWHAKQRAGQDTLPRTKRCGG